jgi:hypothetical protein
MPPRPTTLRDALLSLGVRADDLSALEHWAPYSGLGLAERIYRSGLASDHLLIEALVALGATDATARVLSGLPHPAALGAFSRALATKFRALPLEVDRRIVVVALLDPSDTMALEKLSLTSGVVIEPRACRPRVLFEALARAYDVVATKPDGAFLLSRRQQGEDPNLADVDDEDPPAPAASVVGANNGPGLTPPLPPPASSTAGPSVSFASSSSAASTQRPGVDLRPAHSPRVVPDARTAEAAQAGAVVAGRDTLPPMVLSMLVPPLRCCSLFLVRPGIAVGWDVMTSTGRLSTVLVRDVLVPLTAESVLATATSTRRIAVGNARDPTTLERSLFRLLRLPPPRSFVTLPILVGEDVTTLLYGDRDDGDIDDALLDEMRRVGTALGDALAPLQAAGLLGSGIGRFHSPGG